MADAGGKFTGQIKIDAGFGQQPELQFDPSRAVNWYLSQDPNGKNEKNRLRRFRGLRKRKTAAGIFRGAYVLSNATTNLAYFVAANKFCQMDSGLVITELGTLTTSTGFVRIVPNQLEPVAQILIVDGVHGYIWDGASFTTITDPDFPANPNDADYLDGRFIVVNRESNKWAISDFNDGINWNAFADAEITSTPGDTLVGISVLHRRIYLFGLKTVETWYDEGRATFPFRRDNNIALDYGCAAVGSIARGFDYLFFLVNNAAGVGAIMIVTGAIPEPVRNPAFEFQLQQYTNPSDAVGYVTRTDDGHVQYVLNFTTDDHTWVYDVETDRLFEKEMLDGSRHVGQVHFYFNNKHYLGSYKDGSLYEEEESFLDNDGEAIPYLLVSPVLGDLDHRQFRLDSFEVDFNRGIGIGEAPYDNPMAFLSISRDGGQTFGNRMPQPLSQAGQFTKRTRWLRLGNCGRENVFKIEVVCKNAVSLFGGIVHGYVGSQ